MAVENLIEALVRLLGLKFYGFGAWVINGHMEFTTKNTFFAEENATVIYHPKHYVVIVKKKA